MVVGFPRLYAAASLKRDDRHHGYEFAKMFSAALCRGLIEAAEATQQVTDVIDVFRGFMPRPH